MICAVVLLVFPQILSSGKVVSQPALRVLAGEGGSQLQVEMKLPADVTQMHSERFETPDDFFSKREAEAREARE